MQQFSSKFNGQNVRERVPSVARKILLILQIIAYRKIKLIYEIFFYIYIYFFCSVIHKKFPHLLFLFSYTVGVGENPWIGKISMKRNKGSERREQPWKRPKKLNKRLNIKLSAGFQSIFISYFRAGALNFIL